MEADIFHSFCCNKFVPVHICVIIVVVFGGMVKVDLIEAWKNMPDVLNNFGAFIGTIHFFLAGNKYGAIFME